MYLEASFEGPECAIVVNDEVPWAQSRNYLQVVVDDTLMWRVQTRGKRDTIRVAKGLSKGWHKLVVAKNTEAGIGYLEFAGLITRNLRQPPQKPARRIEFFGNSITCGTGSDLSAIGCGKGQWHDQHNAYLSYGPTTARTLNAQWQLSAVSGIGLIRSCCNLSITMPQVWNKVNMRGDSIVWDFSRYTPDVVTFCLGQNDGIQDSATFCGAYVQFLKTMRTQYPAAAFVLLTSPMADDQLRAAQHNYLDGVVRYMQAAGDKKVSRYFFSKRYHNGCDSHPDLAEHKQIAAELTAYLKQLMQW